MSEWSASKSLDELKNQAPSIVEEAMSEYDPSELLRVCDSIIEDGEISGDEAYQLAEWLNNHREACYSWPGDSLVKLLQEIWSDGKVTKTELRQLGRVLVRIRKESVKRASQQAHDRVLEMVADACSNFDMAHPRLLSIPCTLQIRSHSEPGLLYEVNLEHPTCDCPDWLTQRQRLPVGHITRCCKHVLDAYRHLRPRTGWPGWLAPFLDDGWPPHPHTEWLLADAGGLYALVSTAPKGWANVYVASGNGHGRYGYNIHEDRWAYGEEPPGGDYLAEIIRKKCGV